MAVGQVDVEVAVVVAVEERGAAGHDLRKVERTAGAGLVHEVESGALGPVDEPVAGLSGRRHAGAGQHRDHDDGSVQRDFPTPGSHVEPGYLSALAQPYRGRVV